MLVNRGRLEPALQTSNDCSVCARLLVARPPGRVPCPGPPCCAAPDPTGAGFLWLCHVASPVLTHRARLARKTLRVSVPPWFPLTPWFPYRMHLLAVRAGRGLNSHSSTLTARKSRSRGDHRGKLHNNSVDARGSVVEAAVQSDDFAPSAFEGDCKSGTDRSANGNQFCISSDTGTGRYSVSSRTSTAMYLP